ncbi:uncharacterized protein LOC121199814 [Toxotes jaculatrix]|uniref:uncharacterized protein LOC121199814 n=1 Tax=Toxotes jaculatrix TaxID=941984 RepID=UPI001B3A921F|nr:uncharacterized protein LOC121199814 [Toxotes jaculatrix]
MSGTVLVVMRLLLLLLSLIRTGVNGQGDLIFTGRGYDITYPCDEDLVCFHIWQIRTRKQNKKTSEYIAIVSNGEIQTAESEEKKCTLLIKDLTAEDVGHHRCQQRPNVFSTYKTHSAAPVLNFMPARTVSLQCAFLTYVEYGHCYTSFQQSLSLKWVDEAGSEIQEDSQHHINQRSPCDITLTVSLQSPANKTYRCQATVDEQVQTSTELQVRAPALNGKGRGIFIELEPEYQGGNRDMIGAAVGVVGCMVLIAAVAGFVVNRRRRRNTQLFDESCSVQSTNNNGMKTDDVIYADIILPVDSDRVVVHECESTEYACVRYR